MKRAVSSEWSLRHLLLFVSLCLSSHLISSVVRLQPSSPGDYYSSMESDMKLELTEKLSALDSEGNSSSAATQVGNHSHANIPYLFSHQTFSSVSPLF